ncbi:adenylyl-sulfate kinase [Pseudogracilibacillus sp. SO30301A]|uniref:adenylyl-sulfate kinase n=1 Tax=Pseudogracilibacillus sp. SO30301A TaxID=3098291 RepID=UPI00300E5CFB
MSNNLTWHLPIVTKEDRIKVHGHQGAVVWFTGLSGSGKSTLANAVDYKLYQDKRRSYILDGDNIRHGLNKDLKFSDKDRQENIRRIGEVANLFVDSGQIVLTAFISPFQADRERVRKLFKKGEFIEIYVKCSLEICEKRDPKGLYQKAREGIIPKFTGISSPYEEPICPELIIETDKLSIEQGANMVIHYLKENKILE